MYVTVQENEQKVHFDIVTLVYNASKLAVDRINTALNEQSHVA